MLLTSPSPSSRRRSCPRWRSSRAASAATSRRRQPRCAASSPRASASPSWMLPTRSTAFPARGFSASCTRSGCLAGWPLPPRSFLGLFDREALVGGGIPSCRGVRQGVVLGAHGYRIATGVGQGSWLHRRRAPCTTPNAQRVGGRHPRGRHGAQRFSHPQRRVIARRRRRLRRVLAPAALVAGDTCGGHVRMRGGRVKRTPPAYAHAGRTACGPAGG